MNRKCYSPQYKRLKAKIKELEADIHTLFKTALSYDSAIQNAQNYASNTYSKVYKTSFYHLINKYFLPEEKPPKNESL